MQDEDGRQLHGSIQTNLAAAIRSARRLRQHPVHSETIGHWTHLLHQARRRLATALDEDTSLIQQFVIELEEELALRS